MALQTYRVNVVASYTPDVDMFGTIGRLPKDAKGHPEMDTSAVDIRLNDSVMIEPLRQTMTVTYDVEGSDEDEACRFALAIFQRESPPWGLPQPETLVANPD